MMRIFKENRNFLPENFNIFRFYGNTLLFAWHGDKLNLFNYDDDNPLNVSNSCLILAPREIKNIHNYDERIFITCYPNGVYKLWQKYKFVMLSSTGVGIGAKFYEVLKIDNNYLLLGNKQNNTTRLLLKYTFVEGATLNSIGFIFKNMDDRLLSVLQEEENEIIDYNDGICFFINGFDIYKITSNKVKIIYNSLYMINSIVDVKKNEKLLYLLYITEKNIIILMYAKNNEFVFEKIELNNKIKTACAFVDDISENTLWIIHSDGNKTYTTRKIVGENSVDSLELNETNVNCLRYYKSNIIGLNSIGELVMIDPKIEEISMDKKNEEFVTLRRDMLQGTEQLVEEICEKVKELQSLDKELLNEQNILKRINLSACEQSVSVTPYLKSQKIAKQTFVNCKFGHGLPENSQISFSLKSNGRKVFGVKKVNENDTNIELPIPDFISSEELNITIDLITLAEENYSWFLINDFMKWTENDDSDVKISDNKKYFVESRLALLQKLKSKELDIAKLNMIKDSVRKKFNVI